MYGPKSDPLQLAEYFFLLVRALRMYCIDTPRKPEGTDAGTFNCLFDYLTRPLRLSRPLKT